MIELLTKSSYSYWVLYILCHHVDTLDHREPCNQELAEELPLRKLILENLSIGPSKNAKLVMKITELNKVMWSRKEVKIFWFMISCWLVLCKGLCFFSCLSVVFLFQRDVPRMIITVQPPGLFTLYQIIHDPVLISAHLIKCKDPERHTYFYSVVLEFFFAYSLSIR